METANKVIVTLILCFIFLSAFMTYLAVLVRALRIKNATLKNRLDLTEKDLKDSFDEHDRLKQIADKYKDHWFQADAKLTIHRAESAKILNTSTKNNSRLLIEISKVKEDNAKLFDIAKGAVAKLAEMNTEVDRIVGEKEEKTELRSVEFLTNKECIYLKNSKERDAILKLFKDVNYCWMGGVDVNNYKPKTPICVMMMADRLFVISRGKAKQLGMTIYKPSQFLRP